MDWLALDRDNSIYKKLVANLVTAIWTPYGWQFRRLHTSPGAITNITL